MHTTLYNPVFRDHILSYRL